MKKPNMLQFAIHKAEEGGFYAEAIGFSIYTQGETIDETISNIRGAVLCHFADENSVELHNLPIIANYEIPQLV